MLLGMEKLHLTSPMGKEWKKNWTKNPNWIGTFYSLQKNQHILILEIVLFMS